MDILDGILNVKVEVDAFVELEAGCATAGACEVDTDEEDLCLSFFLCESLCDSDPPLANFKARLAALSSLRGGARDPAGGRLRHGGRGGDLPFHKSCMHVCYRNKHALNIQSVDFISEGSFRLTSNLSASA